MHHTREVDEDTKKPEIVLYYNNTKGGVDSYSIIVTIQLVVVQGAGLW